LVRTISRGIVSRVQAVSIVLDYLMTYLYHHLIRIKLKKLDSQEEL